MTCGITRAINLFGFVGMSHATPSVVGGLGLPTLAADIDGRQVLAAFRGRSHIVPNRPEEVWCPCDYAG
ncbi:hypothetical protein Lfu02_43850 [Longispora fulva]|nr:hypothetical protein Lfu02_43850 [Longispora fulva]